MMCTFCGFANEVVCHGKNNPPKWVAVTMPFFGALFPLCL